MVNYPGNLLINHLTVFDRLVHPLQPTNPVCEFEAELLLPVLH